MEHVTEVLSVLAKLDPLQFALLVVLVAVLVVGRIALKAIVAVTKTKENSK